MTSERLVFISNDNAKSFFDKRKIIFTESFVIITDLLMIIFNFQYFMNFLFQNKLILTLNLKGFKFEHSAFA